jgi:DNA invertase Pin-like site-specific DNA recombinase
MSMMKRKLSVKNKVSKKTKLTKVSNPKKDYVIYCRVSTTEQSLESQEHSCVKFCEENNFNVIEIIQESCSARKTNSQKKLRKFINENTDVTIVVNSVDRFSRNVLECFNMFDIMKKNNINLISVTDNIDLSTAYGKHAFRTRVSTAQLESDSISERVRRTINYKKEHGLALTSRVKYGYKVVDGKKQIDLHEHSVIQFVNKCNYKNMTAKQFSKELYDLMKIFNKPEDFYVPVVFEENNKQTNTARITPEILADILNDYDILRRNKYWSANSIRNIMYNVNSIQMDFTL